jgi:hypothetical protein
LVLFFRKEQERKTLHFLKKKKQKDFFPVAASGELFFFGFGGRFGSSKGEKTDGKLTSIYGTIVVEISGSAIAWK